MIHVLNWTNPGLTPISLWMDEEGLLVWVTYGKTPPFTGSFNAEILLKANEKYIGEVKVEWKI